MSRSRLPWWSLPLLLTLPTVACRPRVEYVPVPCLVPPVPPRRPLTLASVVARQAALPPATSLEEQLLRLEELLAAYALDLANSTGREDQLEAILRGISGR